MCGGGSQRSFVITVSSPTYFILYLMLNSQLHLTLLYLRLMTKKLQISSIYSVFSPSTFLTIKEIRLIALLFLVFLRPITPFIPSSVRLLLVLFTRLLAAQIQKQWAMRCSGKLCFYFLALGQIRLE